MSVPGVKLRPPAQPIWRVGRNERPWEFPDWMYATDGRFRGRYDDPDGLYRVLYAATNRLGAFLEALRDFRRDGHLAEELDQYGPPDAVEPGVVPRSWVEERWIASAVLKGDYADVQHSAWIGYLHHTFRGRLPDWGLAELDGSTLRSTTNEDATRAVSREVFVATTVAGRPLFDGITYESRFGCDVRCWAVFEHPNVAEKPWTAIDAAPIAPDDVDLLEACRIHGIRMASETDPQPVSGVADSRDHGAGGSDWR